MARSLRKTSGRQQVIEGLGLIDREVFEAVANAKTPIMDELLPRLTRAANYSKLWMGIAAGMALTRSPRLHRAAARGLVSLAATSLITNQGAKRLRRRERPGHNSVPFRRRIRHYPTSSSFPSGHAASAAAFAVGAGLEDPPAGYTLGVLAALVGLSRVYTGAHYPGDVLVGWAIGAGVALVGGKLVPPPVPTQRPHSEPFLVTDPRRPEGQGLVIVVNPASGSGTGERVLAQVERALPQAEIVALRENDDIDRVMRDAADRAEVLGVAGGDGTVGTAAAVALKAGKPLAVFPAGTFNHFAKEIGCPTPEQTIDAVRAGSIEMVDVVQLNGETIIVNTASIGAYPQFVEIREKYEGKIGKTLAAVVAAWKMVGEERAVTIRFDNKTVKTSLFFVGNSLYVPTGFAPQVRPSVDDGLIDVRILEGGKPFARTRFICALLLGELGRSRLYHELRVPRFTFDVVGEPTPVAHDGEVGEALSHIDFVSLYRVLPVFRPRRERKVRDSVGRGR